MPYPCGGACCGGSGCAPLFPCTSPRVKVCSRAHRCLVYILNCSMLSHDMQKQLLSHSGVLIISCVHIEAAHLTVTMHTKACMMLAHALHVTELICTWFCV